MEGGLAEQKTCANCTTTDTPLWRYERTLEMLLCNACSIWYRTKKYHRPKPSPEALAKKAAMAARKAASAPAHTDSHSPVSTSPDSDSERPGKRKRRARDWGEDVVLYADGSPECTAASEHDIDAMVTSLAVAYVASDDKLTLSSAAEVLRSLKKARTSKDLTRGLEMPTQSAHVEKPSCYVTVTVSMKRKSSGSKRTANRNLRCVNCGVTETPVWREAGGMYPLCNACGVFQKTNGVPRIPPASLQPPSQPRQRMSRNNNKKLHSYEDASLAVADRTYTGTNTMRSLQPNARRHGAHSADEDYIPPMKLNGSSLPVARPVEYPPSQRASVDVIKGSIPNKHEMHRAPLHSSLEPCPGFAPSPILSVRPAGVPTKEGLKRLLFQQPLLKEGRSVLSINVDAFTVLPTAAQ